MLQRLKELLKHKKSASYYATKLNITVDEVRELMKELKNPHVTYIEGTFSWEHKVNNEKGTLESSIETTFEPKNDEELAVLHKVDLSKYKISNYYSKLKANGKFTSTVFCTIKKPTDYTIEDFTKFLSSYKPVAYLTPSIPNLNKDVVDVEVSIADFHLAKKTLTNETLEDKVIHFTETLKDLVQKVTRTYAIDTLVFPISNDFFHTDNYQNQTTNGTPQDVLVRYDHEYEAGFDLLVKSIDFLHSNCEEIEIILVQGNHDRTKSFYLAHALEVYFKNIPTITFKREHRVTKATVLGNTFIGYHHGNCKIDDLPLLFATGEYSQAFGNAKYREIHTGDKHHYMAKEIKGVRIQQMPSLSGTDRWHEDNNFVHSIRAGIATCYDFLTGRCAEFESRITV